MREFFLTTSFVLFLVAVVHSQSIDSASTTFGYQMKKDLSLLVGYNQGKYSFGEIGLAINQYGTNRHPFSIDYFISGELTVGNKTIVGSKLGLWVAGGFAMGLNFIYYTDFDRSCFVFRPEIGIGLDKAKLVYGYNWNWTKSLDGINKHLIGLTYCFKLTRLKTVETQ